MLHATKKCECWDNAKREMGPARFNTDLGHEIIHDQLSLSDILLQAGINDAQHHYRVKSLPTGPDYFRDAVYLSRGFIETFLLLRKRADNGFLSLLIVISSAINNCRCDRDIR